MAPLRRASEALSLWLVVAGALMLETQMVDDTQIPSVLSPGQPHATAGAEAGSLRAVAAAVGATRRWEHLSAPLAVDAWTLVL